MSGGNRVWGSTLDEPFRLDQERGYASRNLVTQPNLLVASAPPPPAPAPSAADKPAEQLSQAELKARRTREAQSKRLLENKAYLVDPNVKAFLQAIGEAEGGGYDFKYGAVKGKKNDPWRFSDTSTHPGFGSGKKSTASGMYQITIATWRDHGQDRMGLTDFSNETQDLIAVNLLRSVGVIENIRNGDIGTALSKASRKWAALPQGKDQGNRYPEQPYMPYDEFVGHYKRFGGKVQK